ncbi:hypothetical protein FA95DRAFT_83485 [Auriscalpium vulgare]|uniref:Uncharacterized protein n=1 Tax=Auriscalpium vulgare TaxID=40419 RepID=A0ACB8RQ61_9AGAM|nr:hypothetical protein FA95DRAFT_83485 [Auriscalpium vulgare]
MQGSGHRESEGRERGGSGRKVNGTCLSYANRPRYILTGRDTGKQNQICPPPRPSAWTGLTAFVSGPDGVGCISHRQQVVQIAMHAQVSLSETCRELPAWHSGGSHWTETSTGRDSDSDSEATADIRCGLLVRCKLLVGDIRLLNYRVPRQDTSKRVARVLVETLRHVFNPACL